MPSDTMQKANTEQLLAEYMEKFGKKLNEQESRTGDELFMWLKDKLPESYQSGVEAERKRLTNFISESFYDLTSATVEDVLVALHELDTKNSDISNDY